jgi:hypothetical protein
MTLPAPVRALWEELEAVRAEVLREVDGLSQRQADWRPADNEWSPGEIVDHLTIAENATGKLTTKLTREAEAAGAAPVFPAGLDAFTPLPAGPAGPAEAPSLGDLDLAQWWMLQAHHDGVHLAQIRAAKSAPGFPRE